MASKRDYYEVLGVKKTATDAEIKEHIEPWRRNTTRTRILAMRQLQRSLKRLLRPTRYCLMLRRGRCMINLEWLLLMAQVELQEEIHLVAEDSTLKVETSEICLAIYLARFLAEEEVAHREAVSAALAVTSMPEAEIWRQVSR